MVQLWTWNIFDVDISENTRTIPTAVFAQNWLAEALYAVELESCDPACRMVEQ